MRTHSTHTRHIDKCILNITITQIMTAEYSAESHCVMKAPIHSLYIEHLMEVFPNANIVVTHRDPCRVVSSYAKLGMLLMYQRAHVGIYCCVSVCVYFVGIERLNA